MPQAVEMGKISFNYLPASPLNNGWRPALREKTALTASVPSDRADGLSIRAEDAIDIDVEKHQRVCNHVQFFAKLTHDSYVYAKIEVVSRDTHTVSRRVWIACDSGNKPPRKVSRDEWAIHRMPQQDGWTRFDLHLPEEVADTYGQAEGLQFSELLGFRLRGSLSVSPITLLRIESVEASSGQSTNDTNTPTTASGEPWNRGHRIAVWSLLFLIFGIILSLFVPEVRRFLHLEKPASIPSLSPSTSSLSSNRDLTKLFANTAGSVQELRQQDHVTQLADSESEKTFTEIPTDTYGFAGGPDIHYDSLDSLLIESMNYDQLFEIHKLSDGTGLVVGYVGPETFEHLREGTAPGTALSLYSGSLEEAPNLIAVSIKRLKCGRSRNVVAGNSIRGAVVEVLDCVVQ